ncbi:MAG: GNAT family N-acetyltransferase [Bacteroidota bacterium]
MHFLYSNAILESEFAVLQATSRTEHEGYYVHFHSEKYPNFYDGNALWCLDHPNVRVHKLVEKWNEYFPNAQHRNIFLNAWSDEQSLIQQAKEAGFKAIDRSRFMVASTHLAEAPAAEHIHPIQSEQDWIEFQQHVDKCNPTIPWFAGEGFEKKREASTKMPIHWFVYRDPETKEILSSAGVFKHRHLSRLQDVQTNPDRFREGLSTKVVKQVIHYAQKQLGVDQIALVCDPNYHAYTFYQKLGFEDRFDLFQLKDFPFLD